jgi:hypothetical protein
MNEVIGAIGPEEMVRKRFVFRDHSELKGPEAERILEENRSRITPIPQIMRGRDGSLEDSYDFLKSQGIQLVADSKKGWSQSGRWYFVILPEGMRVNQDDMVTGGYEEAEQEIHFSIRGRRVDVININLSEEQYYQPYILV